MNRPGHFDYVIGNFVALAALFGGTWASAMACCTPEHATPGLAWLIPVCGFALTSAAVKARRRVVAYTAWKRRWDAMSGPAEPGQAEAAPRARRRMRRVWAVLLWLALTGWLVAHDGEQGTPAYGMAALGFLSLTGIGLGVGLVKAVRRMFRRGAPARAEGGYVVTVLPRVPRSSPSAAKLTGALPDYCRAIMARGERPQAQ